MPPPGRRWQAPVDWLLAGVLGAALLWLSDLLVPPATAPFPGHGERFAEMVAHPFAFQGPFPQRVLWPMLAHAAGWFGLGPVGFSRLCSGALLAVVCWFVRRRGAGWSDAVLLTAAVAATGAVQVYKPMACMTADTLNLLLLLLTIQCVDRPVRFWALVALASFSHEMVLFFGPWLWWLRLQHGGSWWRDGLALGGCAALHGAWRLTVSAAYDASYYASNNFWVPWGMPALWALWLLVALAEFGPLLAVSVWSWRSRVHGLGGRLGPWLYLGCALSLMVFAYDVMRFATFLAVPVLLGGLAMLRVPHGRTAFAALLVASVATYAWQHPVASEQGGRAFTEVTAAVLPLLPATLADRGHRLTSGEGLDFTLALLRQQPWTWCAVLAATLGLVALSLVLVRYVRPARDASSGGSVPRTRQNPSA